ncbi:potassium uptake protein [Gaeumannomyces tritici R3-111a-1]|uniref:Potassium uptake protein n=1 Tax=Gaeumannomyces tritici (strain R3-111a-1) TaxID=644352 RepID=J3PBY0_GAET3|nr:potassium uptake protein [Gaeumannomyces tritici R3-111a-1]EJT71750.1 potassium uptake protein [Gaeumannomyces tritici R3-111a-1]
MAEDNNPQLALNVKIAEGAHPGRAAAAQNGTTPITPLTRVDTGYVGGVYNARAMDRARSRNTGFSLSRRQSVVSARSVDDGEGGAWLNDGVKEKQVFRGSTLMWLAYQSVGVIYGDIGTSPLYVFSSTFTSEPSPADVIGVLSIILWSITLVVTVKYVLIVLLADNEGEGGTFSCYSLLTRYANITDRDPREQGLVKMKRQLTGDLKPGTGTLRTTLEKSRFFRGLLKAIGVLSVSMVMADGVLTPAQSVLGAVQGLSVVKPDISQPTIVGSTCGIIVLLFLIQPLGVTKLASGFAPVVILWLAFNGGFGIYNLAMHDWTVLKAFSPHFAFGFFAQHKTEAWKMLGGILLSFTGVEALFADLGAFSLGAIRISWLCYTYPCLLLAYSGQAAFITQTPSAYSNPFFNTVPPGMLYPSLVLAVLAAIVASQAIITATFQLVSQLMKLSYSPQVKVVHVSRVFHGQVYVPMLNWLLMAGAVLVTAVYRDTTRLGNAYGVCVMFVTFFDTCMVTLVAIIVWRLSPFLVFLPWLFFATIDGLYLSSSLTKVPDGAWLTLLVSGALACMFLLWRFGKENQWRAEAEDRFKLGTLVTAAAPGTSGSSSNEKTGDSNGSRHDGDDGQAPAALPPSPPPPPPPPPHHGQPLRLTDRWGGETLSTIRGLGIFFDKSGTTTPTVFSQFVTKFVAVPEVAVFFHLHPVDAPTVDGADRYLVQRFREIPGCYRLIVKHGFMDEVITPDLAALVYEQVRADVERGAAAKPADADAAAVAFSTAVEAKGPIDDVTGAEEEAAAVDGNGNGDAILRQRRPVTLADEDEDEDARVAAELARLDRAFAAKVMYVVGKEQMRVREGTGFGRRVVLSTFLWIRENTRAKIANLRLAMERVVEVGFVKDI